VVGQGENPEVVKGVYEVSFENFNIDVIFSEPKKESIENVKSRSTSSSREVGAYFINEFDFTFRQFFFDGKRVYGFRHSLGDVKNKKLNIYSFRTAKSSLVRYQLFAKRYGFTPSKIDQRILNTKAVQNAVDYLAKVTESFEGASKGSYNQEEIIDLLREKSIKSGTVSAQEFLQKLLLGDIKAIVQYESGMEKEIIEGLQDAIRMFYSEQTELSNEYRIVASLLSSGDSKIFRWRNRLAYIYKHGLFGKMSKTIKVKLEPFDYIKFLDNFFVEFSGEEMFEKIEEALKQKKLMGTFSPPSDDEEETKRDESIVKGIFGHTPADLSLYLINENITWGLENKFYKEGVTDPKILKKRFLEEAMKSTEKIFNYIYYGISKSRYLSQTLEIKVCAKRLMLFGGVSPTFEARLTGKEIEDMNRTIILKQKRVNPDFVHQARLNTVFSTKLNLNVLENNVTKERKNSFVYDGLALRMTEDDREEVVDILRSKLGLKIKNYTKEDVAKSLVESGFYNLNTYRGGKEGFTLVSMEQVI